MALFGSAGTPRRCPLLGLIRTLSLHRRMAESDPQETLAARDQARCWASLLHALDSHGDHIGSTAALARLRPERSIAIRRRIAGKCPANESNAFLAARRLLPCRVAARVSRPASRSTSAAAGRRSS